MHQLFFGMLTALILGAATGAFSEYFRFTRNGYVVSIAIAVGGAVILFFAQKVLGLGLGFERAGTAIIGAVAALFIA